MSAPRLGPHERELLLACARVDLDDGTAARIGALLEQPLAWDSLTFHARLHSVGPLLHRHLGEAVRVPHAARRELLALSHRAAYQNLIFAEEHRALVGAFDDAGVPVLVQKGLAVAEPLYGQLALRPLVDLIYLVPADRRRDAAEVVRTCGYSATPPHSLDRIYRWSCPQLVFERAGRLEVSVIVQSDLVSWPRMHAVRADMLWARSERRELAGRVVRVLEPTDFLMYLCLQADNHGHFNRVALGSLDAQALLFAEWTNNRLVRFVDMHELVRREAARLDWDALVHRAGVGGVRGAVHASLSLASELLGTHVPAEAIEQVRAPVRQRLRRLVLESLAASERPGAPRLKSAAGTAWRRRRPRNQIRLARLIGLVELAFPSAHLLRLRYGFRGVALVPVAVAHSTVTVLRSLLAVATAPLAAMTARPTRLRFRVRF
jgi:hypothetical protein